MEADDVAHSEDGRPLNYGQGMLDVYSYLIFAISLLTTAFGLFGNVVVMLAVAKYKDLKTKHGALLSFLCLYQSLVLIFELIASARNLVGDISSQQTCFYYYLPMSFFNNVQLVLVLIRTHDLAFLVFKPTMYNKVQIYPYSIIVQIPCALFAFAFVIAGVLLVDRDEIALCGFAWTNPTSLKLAWCIAEIFVCIAVILVYALVSFTMHLRDWRDKHKTEGVCKVDPSLRYQRKMIRTLSVLIGAFLCTAFASSLLFLVEETAPFLTDNARLYLGSFATKLGLISCAQNFFIYYRTSKDFQKAFKKIFASWKKWRKEKLHLPKSAKVTMSAAFGQ